MASSAPARIATPATQRQGESRKLAVRALSTPAKPGEKAQHVRRGIGTGGIGIGAGRVATGPGVGSAVHYPLLGRHAAVRIREYCARVVAPSGDRSAFDSR